MKNLSKYFIAVILTAAFSQPLFAQDKNVVTKTFWVAGVCGLCEEVIEKTMDTKGVVSADYVLETNQLTVTYKPAKISEERLHQLLNDAGYDTEKATASEEQYSRVHHCCRYREQEKH